MRVYMIAECLLFPVKKVAGLGKAEGMMENKASEWKNQRKSILFDYSKSRVPNPQSNSHL